MANFSELPEELMESFMKRLSCIDDLVHAAVACKSWQSVSAAARKMPRFSPWLMQTNDDTDAQNLRTFSCLSSNREFTFELADIHNRRCWGTPFGWMVTCDLDLNFHLVNPISGVQLDLPPQSTFPNQFPKITEAVWMQPEWLQSSCPLRFALSSNPSNQNQSCVVIAVYNPEGKLCFARPGDNSWTPIETTLRRYSDAIYFKGLVYALDRERGFLMVCDINTPHPKGTLIESASPRDRSRDGKIYLVELSGELHLVARYYDFVRDNVETNCHSITKDIYVYKFDFHTSWTEVSDLGDHALFVGNNSSFVLSTNDYPEFKRNAIYCTDDDTFNFGKSFCDMAVYDYAKRTSEPFYKGTNVTSIFSRPIFLIPSL